MKCYYARAISLYQTPQSARDIRTITQLGFEVVDPDLPEHNVGYQKEGMSYFTDLVASCGVLAFRATQHGRIPAGVAKEVDVAMGCGIPVIELPGSLVRRTMTIEETREYLVDVGHR
jgi:hypothetical protein